MAVQSRPPVITIMGHVDHGKTSLLDYIRKTRIVSGEAGGITQHIGAYQVEFQGTAASGGVKKKLTFIDTPGHAAFTKMRERGAQVTDIVVLVVAANDGVKPQTIESIRHIKNSKASLVVAINKIDLDNVYPDMAKAQLAEHDIKVVGYGGSVDAIELSAKTGKGVDNLLETLVAMAELEDLKADPAAPLEAVVVESTKDPRRGPVATVIVKNGTLSIRQDVYTVEAEGRIRQLSDENGKPLVDVTPGSPAEIIGFTTVPSVGAVVRDSAAEYSTDISEGLSQEAGAADQASQASNDFDIDALLNPKPKMKLIIKADVQGTLEAIINTLDAESVELIGSGVGPVIEQDVELAEATDALLISFHTKVSKQVKELAKKNGVKLKTYDIIYELIEDLQKRMLKLLEPTIDEVVTGEAEILQLFEMKGETIAGCRVKTGEIKKNDLLHLKRGDEIIANPAIKNMMHGKQDVDVTKAKNECGLTFKNKKLDFKVGDTIIAYHEEE